MTDLLSSYYPWIKSLHIISVITWMAGLFYLPRLFVYHVEQAGDIKEIQMVFRIMERKLLRLIMNPAMVATWTFGGFLILTPGLVDWSSVWPWIKAAAVLAMTLYHHWLGRRRTELAAGTCTITGRGFRMMNEVPTALMVVIVIMVVVRPI